MGKIAEGGKYKGTKVLWKGKTYTILDNFITGTRGSDHYSTDIEMFRMKEEEGHIIEEPMSEVLNRKCGDFLGGKMVDLDRMKAIAKSASMLRWTPRVSNQDFNNMIEEIETLRNEVAELEAELEKEVDYDGPIIDYGPILPLEERVRKAKEHHANRKKKKDMIE